MTFLEKQIEEIEATPAYGGGNKEWIKHRGDIMKLCRRIREEIKKIEQECKEENDIKNNSKTNDICIGSSIFYEPKNIEELKKYENRLIGLNRD